VIRLTVPQLEADDFDAVRAVLETGQLVQGPRVAAFEREAARRAGAAHGVAVSSGTAALHLALLALGVRPGDLVVVTAYSWPATANAVELCGARPVFVDIEPDTYNLDPARLEEALRRLTAGPDAARHVRAVLPVHAFGQPADMTAVLACAGRYGLPVVEDAACALGATWDGRPAGSWGRLGCFSFHPRKAVTTGEGGLVTTDDPALAGRLRALRNHGQDPAAPGPDFILPGFNYRLTEFQAALGLTQLAKLDGILAARRERAARYDALLAPTPLAPPAVRPRAGAVYQSYVLRLPPEAADRRDAIVRGLRARGVEATLGTWHLPLTTYFRSRYGHRPGDFPMADAVFRSALTLPLHPRLTEPEQAFVVEQLLAELGGAGALPRAG
jgi:dTDP-4-amino-4,6-dideoxygalactose transaminase